MNSPEPNLTKLTRIATMKTPKTNKWLNCQEWVREQVEKPSISFEDTPGARCFSNEARSVGMSGKDLAGGVGSGWSFL